MKAKHYLMPAVLTMFTLVGSGCTTTDENGEVASASTRECRSFGSPGTKMKESVCRTREQWAVIDANEAEKQNRGELVDEFFRRAAEQGSFGEGQAFDSATGL